MSNFILPRVTESESKCRCGCEVVASLYFLRTISRLLTLYNKPVKITTSYRCPEYNNQIGGVKDSPHLLNDAVFGAADLRCYNPIERMKLIKLIMPMVEKGIFNHVEVCDKHIHLARVSSDHRLANMFNWGRSK
jgi:uncharacterized protein YcbK (DUF882 family)